jgi:hypothetical protein
MPRASWLRYLFEFEPRGVNLTEIVGVELVDVPPLISGVDGAN